MHGESFRDTVSLDVALDEKTVRGLLDGSVALASVLSPAQTRYLQTIAGAWPLAADLRRMGPTRVETLLPKGGLYVVEAWQLPGGQHFTEASQKTARADALRLRAELLAKLTNAGVHLCSDQSSQSAAKLRILAAGRTQ